MEASGLISGQGVWVNETKKEATTILSASSKSGSLAPLMFASSPTWIYGSFAPLLSRSTYLTGQTSPCIHGAPFTGSYKGKNNRLTLDQVESLIG